MTLQIFPTTLVEPAKSADRDFPALTLPSTKFYHESLPGEGICLKLQKHNHPSAKC